MSSQKNRHKPIDEETTSMDNTISSQSETTVKRIKDKQQHQPLNEKTSPILENEHIEDESTSTIKLSPSYWSRFFWGLIIFSISWLLYSTLIDIIAVFKTNVWLAIPLASISMVFITITLLLIKKERAAFKRVDKNAQQRSQIQNYIDENSVIGIHDVLKPRLLMIKKTYPKEYTLFNNARNTRNTADEYLSLLENILLSQCDKDADKAIQKAALSIAALVAISPHPALDAFIVFIRANMLIRQVSHIYGLQPTGLSSLYLLKHSIVSAITAAGIEEISTIIVEEISAGLTEKATKILAEGIVSSSRLYRLGHLTKKITRPLPIKT